ncbi:MAG: beta-N-acetylhexosaminidase [Lachnospiraceae bacterium]|nr:beta-N-acetylhexosaminidase [Lachnospiraceae bacterium]
MKDNDWMDDDERRAARHRRRVHGQILAYLFLVLLIAIILGACFGVFTLVRRYLADQKAQEEQEVIAEVDDTPEEPVEEEPEEEVETGPTAEEQFDEYLTAYISDMTLEEKAAGLLIVTPEQLTGVSIATQGGSGTQAALEEYTVGGIVYSSQNIKSEEQFTEMIANTVSFSKYPLFIAVTEEGGDVSTVLNSAIEVSDVASNLEIGADGASGDAYTQGTTIGGYLSTLGINLDLAPVTEVTISEDAAISDRTYGSDAQTVGTLAAQMSQGLESQGVSSTLKSFPGTGDAASSTEDGAVSTDRDLTSYEENEFVAFQTAIDAGADFVMVSHITASNLSGSLDPVSMCESVVTDLLRDTLGFEGVIITEPMNYDAITDYYDLGDAVVSCLKAGCDMILMPSSVSEAVDAIVEAVEEGTLAEERINDSLLRIYRVKYADMLADFE